MKRSTVVFAVALAALVGLWTETSAELTAGQKQAADVLIKQFSHRDFAVREQAVARLVALGPDVVPIVKKALAETTDNEVKLRCEMVLKAVAAKYAVDVGLAVKAPAKDWGLDASRLTVKLPNADLDRIVEAASEQSGNTLVRLPEAWEGKPVTLEVTDMAYWEALDKLCAQAKLTYAPDYQNGGLRLAPAEGTDVSAYAGPAVVKLDSATRMRTFRAGAGNPLQNALNYRFSFFYEDRLDPIVAEASFTAAVAPDGTALKLAEMPVRAFMGMRGGRGRVAAGQVFANITDVPDDLAKLASLTGVVKLALGEGEKSLKVENALAEGEKSGTLDDTTLTVTSVNRRNTSANLGVKMTVAGKDAPIPNYPFGSPYGFFLIDPNGERHQGTSFGFATFRRGVGAGDDAGGQPGRQRNRGGRRREREAAPGGAAEKLGPDAAGEAGGEVVVVIEAAAGDGVMVRAGVGDANIVVAQAGQRPGRRAPRGANPDPNAIGNVPGALNARGRTNVNFNGLPDVEGVWILVFTMPAKTTEKEFPFEFKDVPLP